MADLSELFAADHASALARATVLDAGDVPDGGASVELPGFTPIDFETLGEIAAEVVRFGTGDLELEEVDLDHENLTELPPYLVDLLAEIGRTDEPDALTDIATRWAATGELDSTADELAALLTDIVALATTALREDRGLYLWTDPLD